MAGTHGPPTGRIEPDASPKSDSGTRSYANPRRQLSISSAVILAFLLALSAVAWAATVRNSRVMSDASMEGQMSGMNEPSTSLSFFLVMWTVMMIAMMFPSVAPMVIAYRRLAAKHSLPWLKSTVFSAGYVVTWSVMGLFAYLLYVGLQRLTPAIGDKGNAVVVAGLLGAAGLYQLSKLKSVCLTHCRGPLAFFFHFRGGLVGGFRMGVEHGVFCAGCCWGLMLILFAFGLMNIAWMGAVAALIFVEKVTPIGPRVSKVAGVSMLAAAAVVGLLGVV